MFVKRLFAVAIVALVMSVTAAIVQAETKTSFLFPSLSTLPDFDIAVATGAPTEDIDASDCGSFINSQLALIKAGQPGTAVNVLARQTFTDEVISPGLRISNATNIVPEFCEILGVAYDLYEATVIEPGEVTAIDLVDFLAPASDRSVMTNADSAVVTGGPVAELNVDSCGSAFVVRKTLFLKKGEKPVAVDALYVGNDDNPIGTRYTDVRLQMIGLCSVGDVLYDFYTATKD